MQKVYVGLSGGVDSATSAALLKQRGYDVTGIFIKIWQPEFIECTWAKDRLDAMRVAAHLGIPFREIDLSDEYKSGVVAEMIERYKAGETPNPDVACNERIKFGSFAQWCLNDGADLIATGHYARIDTIDDEPALLRALDTGKDQSYFLYRMPKELLARTVFPVGSMTKSEVRVMAQEFGLPVAAKHDSQGLCFVGDVSMRDFLRRYIEIPEGVVVDTEGVAIGTHDGAALYTVGQRHGFTVDERNAQRRPHYIVNVDVARNTLTVSPNPSDAMCKGVQLREAHWLADIKVGEALTAQARYHEIPIEVRYRSDRIDFAKPHVAAKGQSLVLYRGDRCIGGGIVDKVCA